MLKIQPKEFSLKQDNLWRALMGVRSLRIFWPFKQKPTTDQLVDYFQSHPLDPRMLGYDLRQYDGLAYVAQMSDVLDYTSLGTDEIKISGPDVITGFLLVADPYRHDVTTATITVVEDAVDKVISALAVESYFSLNSTLAFLKALSNLNKQLGYGLMKEDLATAVAANNDSRQAWYIPFGAFSDYDLFDISAGIPLKDLTGLAAKATFGANNIIATTAANGTVNTATDIYIVAIGVQGLSRAYLARLPKPAFLHQHVTSPSGTTTVDLEGKKYLKRSTILNLAVAASNNEGRNDSNITDISVRFAKPGVSYLVQAMRWQIFKGFSQLSGRGDPLVDRDGSAGVITGAGLIGMGVLDWRKITKNPYGLNLMNFEKGDLSYVLSMGTTTGSLHFLHEYYDMPDPSVPLSWPAWTPN